MSTVFRTVTWVATQRATVVVAKIETSTAVSIVDVIISSADTQTNVIWVTATAVAKRAVANSHSLRLRKWGDALLIPSLPKARTAWSAAPARRRRSHVTDGAAPIPRQAHQGLIPTVTNYITRTTDVTSTTSVVVTAYTTSTTIATVYQTNIRVLYAQATIDIASTLTITSHPPSILTITATADLIPPRATSTRTDPATSQTPSPPTFQRPSNTLSIPTIAGIAAGSSVLALLLAAFVILSLRRSCRRRRRFPPALDSNADDDLLHARQPTLPPIILPHFAPAAPARHHAAQFHLPASWLLGGGPSWAESGSGSQSGSGPGPESGPGPGPESGPGPGPESGPGPGPGPSAE
ncbi:hypothetical protein VTK56DRAFT_3300 [Thermocarpiscus australiensis]